ncbi:hypothetical protein [Pseudonocardia sp. GCM10023141]|uniref:hypothetical protein n=1 Tax=Pseudonocardia sp. GCM10023141 TaxID=3252653 RepID=UPI0036226B2B
MHGGWVSIARRRARIGAIALAALLTAACAAPVPGPAVPLFPTSGSTSATATAAAKVGVIPDDCPALLSVTDLGALLGLPLNSVAVRTIIGVPLADSGRTERVDCSYSGTANPVRGKALLSVAATAFQDRAAALKQWQINVDASDGDRQDLMIGAATAVLFQRRDEAELSAVYGTGTVTLLLPNGKLPGARTRDDVLKDLAVRVLATMPEVGAAPPAPTGAPAGSPATPPPSPSAAPGANPPKAAGPGY